MKRIVTVLLLSLIAFTHVFAQLRICGSCGREDTAGEENCAYCQTPLPALAKPVKPEQPAALPETTGIGAGGIAVADVIGEAAKDVEQARLSQKAHPALALAFYENASAIMALATGARLPPESRRILRDGVEACRDAMRFTARECPDCGGSGRRRIRFQQLSGAEDAAVVERSTGQPCPQCKGSGQVRSRIGVEETRLRILAGRREASAWQQTQDRQNVGRAWLPSRWVDNLNPAEISSVRKTLAVQCQACVGIGLEECRSCKGSGKLSCRNRGCRQGWITGDDNERLQCPVCHGTAMVTCDICQGRGGVACRKCKGDGMAAECRVCGGEGTVICRNCRTNPRTASRECGLCRGTQRMLCNGCNGDGYR